MSDNLTHTAEADLLAQFVDHHSEEAFAELVRRHLPMVLGVCRRVLEDDHGAQDAAQAVFLALAKKAKGLKRDQPLAGWLHHVAVCVARNERVARARRLRREQEAAAMQHDAAQEPLSPETDAALREWLDHEIDKLPAKYRQPLVMIHLEGQDPAVVASKLRCKEGTLRVWLNRAREKLRNRLTRRGVNITVPALVGWLSLHVEKVSAAVPPDLGAEAAKNAVVWISGGTAVAGLTPHIVGLAKGAIHTMFMSKLKTAAAVVASLAVVTTASALSWQKVYEARDKGLPKTAIAELEPIIVDAMKNKQYAEATKAIAMKIALEGQIEGRKAEEKIFRMTDELAKAPAEMKPVMETILAHWYWEYFLQNRWRFHQRTQTAAPPGDDIQTWDLPRIMSEIDKHFTAALANEKVLKATPVAQFDALLEKGTVPDAYRPTLYDFLAHEALLFYQAGEQGAMQAEDEFEVPAESPVFGTVDAFLKWKPETTDTTSPKLKAIKLFQNLLAFHQKDEDKSAFIDADLERLNFGQNQAVGNEKEKSALYKAALKRFVDDWADHEIAARALFHWASVLQGEQELVEARKLAKRGADTYPKSVGGVWCFNLVQQIESKEVAINTERVWNWSDGCKGAKENVNGGKRDACPTINVTYRNITKIHFRAVSYDFSAFINKLNQRGYDDSFRAELLAAKPTLAWEANLPATVNYKARTENLPAPMDLKKGFYVIVASPDPAFKDQGNPMSICQVWVSDLALVVRQVNQSPTDLQPTKSAMDGFVLNAISGEPLPDATVSFWQQDRRGQQFAFTKVNETKTDVNGMFRYAGDNRNSVWAIAEHKGEQIVSDNQFWTGRGGRDYRPVERTIFFTDRNLYRPGQTIHYKGIAHYFDEKNDKYMTLADREITVVFNDPNGKEIAKAQHKTNAYGSFSGSFTAPRDRLMGQMMIIAQGGVHGATSVNVEEYKRPKFQVDIPAPKEAAKLNAEATVTGKATAYTGAAIGGAKVKWRVVRQVQFPDWCWWGRFWPGYGESQAIAHGSTTTGNDGSFTIKFVAKGDPDVPEENEPTFSFTVYADVTDTTGETRSDQRSISVAYTALKASVSADDWQITGKPVELSVATTTHDGEGQVAEGKVTVYKLKQPDKVVRASLQPTPYFWDWGLIRGGGKQKLPSDPSNPDSWELGDVAVEKAFTTDAEGKATLKADLPAGIYRAMLETNDRFGKKVTARLTIQVFDLKAKQFPVKLPNEFAAEKWSLEPGGSLVALWGTGYDKGRAFIELEHRGQILRSWWTDPDRTQEVIEQLVDEKMRGGFVVRVTYVRENRAYFESKVVDVPWSNKELTVKWEKFRSKLEPGKKETWTAVIGKGGERSDGVMETGSDGKTSTPTLQDSNAPLLPVIAEMVAALYDASLDQFKPFDWIHGFNVFRRESNRVNPLFENSLQSFQQIAGNWDVTFKNVEFSYRHFPPDIVTHWGGFDGVFVGDASASVKSGAYYARNNFGGRMAEMEMVAPQGGAVAMSAAAPPGAPMEMAKAVAGEDKSVMRVTQEKGAEAGPKPDLGKVSPRKNLNETAFFFPHLVSDADGVVKMEFTMPEALTEWKFLGFAHDRDLRSGYLEDKTVTAKDLMVEPNPPRFVREGDMIEFTVKVSNQSAARQTGVVKLTFADARTLESRDEAVQNMRIVVTTNGHENIVSFGPEQKFDVPAKESRTYSWRIGIPDGCEFLTYKAVGATDRLSDGEEGYLPVLSRRILVTESLPLPIRGAQTKKFEFEKLVNSGKSKTLKHETLTVQMVSQPAWYAVMALPYLMEYPYECSEQVFNRLYANALARHIANSDPKIRRVFDLWKLGSPEGRARPPGAPNSSASGQPVGLSLPQDPLDSPLFKNQDLKSVMLEETPWLREAVSESQARKNVGILFDANRLDTETAQTWNKLQQMQLGDGLWPWFPGCRGDEYITLYIVTGFGRMRHLGAADVDVSCAVKALNALDNWMDGKYRDILKHMKNPEEYVPSPTDAFYLYGRSFFLEDQKIDPKHQAAVDFFLKQSRKFWLKVGERQSQGHLALGLKRFGDAETPVAIMKSIKEYSVSNEELGMFWRDTEYSWSWYRAPIETQALMIEAFDEVMGDAKAVEDCRVWLLKQKQTQDWKTTKATADAIYGLLLQGTQRRNDGVTEKGSGGKSSTPALQRSSTPIPLLSSDALVEVSLGREKIEPKNIEAGTGFYEERFLRKEITPEMGKVTVKKTDEGMSWGSVHWQYLEDISKVTPHEGTPLKLTKSLWIKEAGKAGQELKPVKGPVNVGDELVVRVELRTDRDMEYIHLKDQRGSGTEPVNVLSQAKFQDGLMYYESTRDTASHFFISYLPKGVYVFEYSVRVQLKGKYQTGIANIQCMYAPEFNSHSESIELEVK